MSPSPAHAASPAADPRTVVPGGAVPYAVASSAVPHALGAIALGITALRATAPHTPHEKKESL